MVRARKDQPGEETKTLPWKGLDNGSPETSQIWPMWREAMPARVDNNSNALERTKR